MATIIEPANLALRFLLELGILGATGYCAWRSIERPRLAVAAAVTVPLVIATVWATVVHGAGVPRPVQIATQVLLFGVAVAALIGTGFPKLAAAFGSLALANAVLMLALAQ
jgi:hypothetical protein